MTGEKYWSVISPSHRERIYMEAMSPEVCNLADILEACDRAFVFLPNKVKAFIYESEDWRSLADEE